ncbi:MAG: hypothetical protein Tsb002_30480 [Wenzhouxiangellaceae bacterium]
MPVQVLAALGVVFALVMSHLAIDWLKVRATKIKASGSNKPYLNSALLFVLDQILHLITLIYASQWLASLVMSDVSVLHASVPTSVTIVVIGYIVCLPAAGHLNRDILAPLIKPYSAGDAPISQKAEDDSRVQDLPQAGQYIGWLERFLVLTAVILGEVTLAGLVIAAKSIFRFEAVKNQRASVEYFLIGTLLSVSEAVAVGLAVRALLQNI